MGTFSKTLATSAAIVAVLAAGVAAMTLGTSTAYAENGSFKIAAANNTGAVYNVYEVFKADVDENDADYADYATDFPPAKYPGVASHVSWPNNTVKTSVLAFLDSAQSVTGASTTYAAWLTANGHTAAVNGVAAHDLPQNAAEYIAEQIGASPNDDAAATTPDTKARLSFALELARKLDADITAAGGTIPTVNENVDYSGEEGYYLFVTKDASIDDEEAGTAAIWVPLGGSTKQVTEKTAIPTITKQVKEDSTGEWGLAADGNKDQDLEYKITGTMPQNIGAFDKYHYKFTDTLPEGMTLASNDTSSVKVTVGGKDETANVKVAANGTISYTNNVLVVDIKDLFTLDSTLTIDKDTVVVVEYKAHINENSAIGLPGNENSVYLTYTANPITDGEADTLPKKTITYTYKLQIHKVDKQTNESLQGAKFTIQVAQSSSDAESRGKYLNADGSLSSTAYTFVTDASGMIEVPRIDEGVYTVIETEAPSHYSKQDADITITINSALDQTTGSLTSWEVAVAGGETDKTVDSDIITCIEQALTSYETGTLYITTSDDRMIFMPITGMDGVTAAIVYGTAAVVIGAVAFVLASRAKRRRSETEEK